MERRVWALAALVLVALVIAAPFVHQPDTATASTGATAARPAG